MADPNLSSFIWSVADLLRGDYKQSEYGRVILPFTVLRRLDCVLEKTKKAVLAEYEKRKQAKINPEPFLLNKAAAPKPRARHDLAPVGTRRHRGKERGSGRSRTDDGGFAINGPPRDSSDETADDAAGRGASRGNSTALGSEAADLSTVIAGWPHLEAATKAAILAIVRDGRGD